MPSDPPHDAESRPDPALPPSAPAGAADESRPADVPVLRVVAGGLADPDWAVVARVLAGEATGDERAAVTRWAAGAPARAEELAALRRWWDAAAHLPTPGRVDAMWRDLSARMAEVPADAPTAPGDARAASAPRSGTRMLRLEPRGSTTRPAARWWPGARVAAAAAVLAVGLAGSAWWWRAGRGAAGGAEVAAGDGAGQPAREYVTRAGQQATLTLADGSRVVLAPASRLRVRVAASGARQAELEGEALFEVRHDARRPFLVRAGHAVTEDLGTTFGVRAYAGDTLVRVVVTEGAVALRTAGTPSGAPVAPAARLGPGDVARLDRAGRAVVVAGGADAYLAWARGRVEFDAVPLGEVAAELGRRYGVPVRVARAADARRRLTVRMDAGPLAEVLDAVTVPLRLGYRREGDAVVIAPPNR